MHGMEGLSLLATSPGYSGAHSSQVPQSRDEDDSCVPADSRCHPNQTLPAFLVLLVFATSFYTQHSLLQEATQDLWPLETLEHRLSQGGDSSPPRSVSCLLGAQRTLRWCCVSALRIKPWPGAFDSEIPRRAVQGTKSTRAASPQGHSFRGHCHGCPPGPPRA